MKSIAEAHKVAIKGRYKKALKLNDIAMFEEFGKIRDRASELGYETDQITDLFREARDEAVK